jgi:hypothetical protein
MAQDCSIRLFRVVALVVLGITMGCGTNPNVRVHRWPDGLLEVDGPLAAPSGTQKSWLRMHARS